MLAGMDNEALESSPSCRGAARGRGSLSTGAATPVVTEVFPNQEALVGRLSQLVQPGDRLLFKASRAVGLDRVVDQFRATSEAAAELRLPHLLG
jgi:UDP-N-acetylmuramoyl-tripeptide--D-alanyl-D-alanine ligase